ncbi:MAG: hypothetical protein ABI581_15155, partial [Sediminibacterium sp.]
SSAILVTRNLPVWIGYFGALVFITGTMLFVSGVALTSLHGLRILVSCLIAWILIVGIVLIKKTAGKNEQ